MARSIQETYRQAMDLFTQGREDKAVAKMTEAIRCELARSEAHFVLAEVHDLLGNGQRAVEECRAAVACQENFVEAQNNLGVLWSKLGRPDLAIEAFQQAVRMEPFRLEPHLNLGIAWLKLGKFEMAGRQALFVRQMDAAFGEALEAAVRRRDVSLTPVAMDHACRHRRTDEDGIFETEG